MLTILIVYEIRASGLKVKVKSPIEHEIDLSTNSQYEVQSSENILTQTEV